MGKKQTPELTAKQVSERTGAAVSTVTYYCREGRFLGAHQEDTPRGPVWYIPESALVGVEIPKRGRPSKKGK